MVGLDQWRFDLSRVCNAIVEGNLRGKLSWIIVVAEGAGSAVEIANKITDRPHTTGRPAYSL